MTEDHAPLRLPAPRPSLWVRIIRATRLVFGRAEEESFQSGPRWVGGVAEGPGFSQVTSLSASAGVAWVNACASARVADLAGLPKVVVRGTGPDAERVENHPVLDLLAMPNSGTTGEEFRRQRYLDLLQTGNAYSLILYAGASPSSVVRIHPEEVRAIPCPQGWAGGYEHTPTRKQYSAEELMHTRLPSWEQGPRGLYGTGKVQPLFHALNAEVAALKRAAEAMARGRPAAMVRPKSDDHPFLPRVVQTILRTWRDATRTDGQLIVLPGAADFEKLDWSPRELEMESLLERNRQQILAVYHTPAVRLGGETANLALAREQLRMYWDSIRQDARLLDAADTRLLRKMDPNARALRVETDFSSVPWLQEDRTARQQRVQGWVSLGASPQDAAQFEGFSDAPLEEAAPEEELPAPAAASLARWLSEPERKAHRELPGDEKERAAQWGAWVRIHERHERRIESQIRRYLTEAADRTAQRAQKVLEARGLGAAKIEDSVYEQIAAVPEEREELSDLLRGFMTAAERAGFEEIAEFGLDVTFDPTESAESRLIDEVTTHVTRESARQIRATVEIGIANGSTIGDMQQAIKGLPAFGRARARLVARTETTRAVNVGARAAMQRAIGSGVQVRQQWLSARDAHVRADHRALDGVEVSVGEAFIVPPRFAEQVHVGAEGLGPGEFAEAGMVANCRCTILPVIDR